MALVIARPGPICDGLVALLRASSHTRQIMQVAESEAALDFVHAVCPDISLLHASPLNSELTSLISKLKVACRKPILVIVANEEDRKMAVAHAADIVVIEGLPSSKLAAHIATLLQQYDDSKPIEPRHPRTAAG